MTPRGGGSGQPFGECGREPLERLVEDERQAVPRPGAPVCGFAQRANDLATPVFKLPPAPPGSNPLSDVRMTEHEVVLVRADAEIASPDGGVFSDFLSIATPTGAVVDVLRGWVSVDVKHKGVRFRFVSVTRMRTPRPTARCRSRSSSPGSRTTRARSSSSGT